MSLIFIFIFIAELMYGFLLFYTQKVEYFSELERIAKCRVDISAAKGAYSADVYYLYFRNFVAIYDDTKGGFSPDPHLVMLEANKYHTKVLREFLPDEWKEKLDELNKPTKPVDPNKMMYDE